MSGRTDTIKGVPRRPRPVPDAERERLVNAREARATAETEFKAAVLAALDAGGSVRDVAATAGISTATVQQWRKDRK